MFRELGIQHGLQPGLTGPAKVRLGVITQVHEPGGGRRDVGQQHVEEAVAAVATRTDRRRLARVVQAGALVDGGVAGGVDGRDRVAGQLRPVEQPAQLGRREIRVGNEVDRLSELPHRCDEICHTEIGPADVPLELDLRVSELLSRASQRQSQCQLLVDLGEAGLDGVADPAALGPGADLCRHPQLGKDLRCHRWWELPFRGQPDAQQGEGRHRLRDHAHEQRVEDVQAQTIHVVGGNDRPDLVKPSVGKQGTRTSARS